MAFAFTWNAAFIAAPSDNENASLGASRIRDLKNALTERMNVDHSWLGDANDGIHLKVTLPAQGADPATVVSTGYVYTRPNGGATELFYKDAAGNILQITNVGKVNGPSIGGTITATFIGNLTGNVTGNVTGSSGSCTGQAATVASVTGAAGNITGSSGSCTGNAATATNSGTSGTVSLTTETGDFGAPIVVSCPWRRNNNVITLQVPATTGASTNGNFQFSGLPAAGLYPATDKTSGVVAVIDNTTPVSASVVFLVGWLKFQKVDGTTFAAAGIKGISTTICITYSLD